MRYLLRQFQGLLRRLLRTALGPGDPPPIWAALAREVQESKILAARSLTLQLQDRGMPASLADMEFKVFSQFGDDGIIQFLIRHTGIAPDETTFVEFGVQDYQEANTRFLLVNDNWRGLILDSSAANMDAVRREEIYWRNDLTAVQAVVDAGNINALLCRHGFHGDIGLLSIDIDGNDYWIWEAINQVNPVIVIVEYNSVFGPNLAVTIPYDPAFQRTRAHYSNLYWGASLGALCLLARKKGYSLVGCNSNGANAYFIRNDRFGSLRPLSAAEGFVQSRFRESRDRSGRLTFISAADRMQQIGHLPVYDVEENRIASLERLLDGASAAA